MRRTALASILWWSQPPVLDAVEGLGYLQIEMQRSRMARLGVSVAQVQGLIETAMGGRIVTTVPQGDRRVDVSIRLPEDFTARIANLRDLPLRLS